MAPHQAARRGRPPETLFPRRRAKPKRMQGVRARTQAEAGEGRQPGEHPRAGEATMQEKEGSRPPDKPKEGGRSEIAVTEEWEKGKDQNQERGKDQAKGPQEGRRRKETGETRERPQDSQAQGQDTRAQEEAKPKARPRPPPTRGPDPPEWLWKVWVELGSWETGEPGRGGP